MTTAHSAQTSCMVAIRICLAITPDKHHSTKLWYFIYAANPGIQPCIIALYDRKIRLLKFFVCFNFVKHWRYEIYLTMKISRSMVVAVCVASNSVYYVLKI